MNKKKLRKQYILTDISSALVSWCLFFYFRESIVEKENFYINEQILNDLNFYIGLVLYITFWQLLHYLSGYYNNPYQKARLKELWITFNTALVGTIVVFFLIIINDKVENYQTYYVLLYILFAIHFTLTYIFRLMITAQVINKINKGKIGYPTILVCSTQNNLSYYYKILQNHHKTKSKFLGYVTIDKNIEGLENYIPFHGNFEQITKVVQKHHIEEILVAVGDKQDFDYKKIISRLKAINVMIKIIPAPSDYFANHVSISTLNNDPLMEIPNIAMSDWETNIKRLYDVVLSTFAIFLLLPVFLVVSAAIKLLTKGPVFFFQERVGKNGKPFKIYKFRTMYTDAEKNGPALASINDPRITPIGRILRNTRIDEIPQFFNVLKGDMAIVGPRPERQFYIDQIVITNPEYLRLQKIKPGITSLGQVKFGYAKNINEIIKRMHYELLYIENMSIYMDIKIMILTVAVVFLRKGAA